MSDQNKQTDLWGHALNQNTATQKTGRKAKAVKDVSLLPDLLGKARVLQVSDFSDPNRKPSCLESDFPIAQINALSNLEGNAGKPIYQMSNRC